ncbi:hemolysin family protein [Alsobacter sp. SYSU M60028]|uniref:Hemolysin family protein n=1 Tax=Alsobacter ponti TaxID=2962936 RepID=A0ABT1LAW9_9HYPH|nr:hemolysin family protein [Alsobacter ponti]MCP8938617.1 hemolysin family protein [Alsobacter ponti]
MSSDDSSTSRPAPRPAPDPDRSREAAGDGFLERILVKLGLKSPASIRDDLEDALSENATATEFSPQERAMLQNVLTLRSHRVDDIMVPRADIVAVPIESTLGDLLRVFRTAGHSRLPVYAETLDDPRGMVHIRDFLDYLASRAETTRTGRRRRLPPDAPDLGKVDLSIPLSAAKILRPVLFVPPSMPALDLLVKMQSLRTHMALVIDEYGGTDGIVSIEDIVEIVVGDIEDEHDLDEAPSVAKAADGTWLADARAGLEEASEAIGVDFEHGESAEDVDTLGGLIATLAGRVPVRGEIIAHQSGWEFEVLDADPRKIKRLRIHPPAVPAPLPAGPRGNGGEAGRTAKGEAKADDKGAAAPASADEARPAAASTSSSADGDTGRDG